LAIPNNLWLEKAAYWEKLRMNSRILSYPSLYLKHGATARNLAQLNTTERNMTQLRANGMQLSTSVRQHDAR
jgi:pyruvate formate-lyase activating enzyme-like uncharacterized protein